MPRRQRPIMVQEVLLNEGEELWDFVQRAAPLPQHMWLPNFDVGTEIDRFARSNGYAPKNVSTLFDRHNGSARGVKKAIEIILKRAEANPQTMHYIVTSGTNLEAVAKYLNMFLFINDMILNNGSRQQVVGVSMLHVAVFVGDAKVLAHNLKSPHVLNSLLQCFAAHGECPICMEEFEQTDTYSPFACGHQMCLSCSKMKHDSCPMCRSTQSSVSSVAVKIVA